MSHVQTNPKVSSQNSLHLRCLELLRGPTVGPPFVPILLTYRAPHKICKVFQKLTDRKESLSGKGWAAYEAI